MKVTVITIVIGAVGTVTKGLIKGLKDLKNKMTGEDQPTYSIIKISQDTEESPGVLRRFVVTQTPVRNHQLILMWKTLKE